MKRNYEQRTAIRRISGSRISSSAIKAAPGIGSLSACLKNLPTNRIGGQRQQWYRDNDYWDRVVASEDHPGGLGGIVYADEIRDIAHERILGKS